MKWNPDIFRKNDIRGIYGKDFDLDFVRYLGIAFAKFISYRTNIRNNSERSITKDKKAFHSSKKDKLLDTPMSLSFVAVGHDSRLSSPDVTNALIEGLTAGQAPIQFLGLVSTPVCFVASHFFPDTAASVMVTASHNPADFNGFKFSVYEETLCDEKLQELKDIILQLSTDDSLLAKTKSTSLSDKHCVSDSGHLTNINREKKSVKSLDNTVISFYVQLMKKKFSQLGKMWKDQGSIVVDCGNGAAGPVAQAVFKELGLNAEWLYADPDGRFPNHHPDPSLDENLNDLRQKVRSCGAKFGVALDGDGDRLVVISESGRVLYGDELMAIFISDIWKRNKDAGVIVADVKCAPWFFDFLETQKSALALGKHDLQNSDNNVNEAAAKPLPLEKQRRDNNVNEAAAKPLPLGGSGHSLIRRRTLALGAIFGGEFSGHYFFCDEGYFLDDGVYATLRLLRILCESGVYRVEELLDKILPTNIGVHTNEIRIAVNDIARAHKLLNRVKDHYAKYSEAQLCLVDGVRVCFPGKAWGLARLSNTQSMFTFRFGGRSDKELKKIQSDFYRLLECS